MIPLLVVAIVIIIIYETMKYIKRINPNITYTKIAKSVVNDREEPRIKQLEAFNAGGFIFGQKGLNFIHKPEDEDGHVLVIGGVGSGKSSCIAIPTLLSWNSRVFAIDIKGELKKYTEKYRINSKIFEPGVKDTIGYDPFYLLRTSENKVQEAKTIAFALIPLPPEITEPYWIESAQNLLIGSILYFEGLDYSFIDTMINIQSMPINELIEEIRNGDNEDAKIFVNPYATADTKLLAGITSQLSNKINVFATDPQLKNALNKEQNIKPTDLECGIDIYIVIQESKIRQWTGLLTLITNQFLNHFENRQDDRNNTPILFLLDEFPRLGKISSIVDGLATLRSKKITICLIIQSLAQIDLHYGKTERQVIVSMCGYKVVLSALDPNSQEYFSVLVGTYTKEKTTYSTASDRDGRTRTITTEKDRIVQPETLAYLENELLLLTPKKYMWVDKTPFFSHPALKKRTGILR